MEIAIVNIAPMLKLPHTRVFFREWRKHRGLTQEQAAERMEFTQESISRLERGYVGYTQESLEAMAFAYGCDPEDLFRHPDEPENAVKSILRGLDAPRQAQALRLLKALVEDEAA